MPGWVVTAHESGGRTTLRMQHPLGDEYHVELPRSDTEQVVEWLQHLLVGPGELAVERRVLEAAPALQNARAVSGVRQAAQALDWKHADVLGVVQLLLEHGVLNRLEADWLTGYCGSDAPLRANMAFDN